MYIDIFSLNSYWLKYKKYTRGREETQIEFENISIEYNRMYYVESRNNRLRIVDQRGKIVLQNEIAEPSIYVRFLDMIMRDIIVHIEDNGNRIIHEYKRRNPIQTYVYGKYNIIINFSRLRTTL